MRSRTFSGSGDESQGATISRVYITPFPQNARPRAEKKSSEAYEGDERNFIMAKLQFGREEQHKFRRKHLEKKMQERIHNNLKVQILKGMEGDKGVKAIHPPCWLRLVGVGRWPWTTRGATCWGMGRVPGAGGCCLLPRAVHLVFELPETIAQCI